MRFYDENVKSTRHLGISSLLHAKPSGSAFRDLRLGIAGTAEAGLQHYKQGRRKLSRILSAWLRFPVRTGPEASGGLREVPPASGPMFRVPEQTPDGTMEPQPETALPAALSGWVQEIVLSIPGACPWYHRGADDW